VNLVLNNLTYTSNPDITSTSWYHVAVTVQRSTPSPIGTFYINGAPAGTFTPTPTNLNSSSPLLIGASFLAGLTGLPAASRQEFAIDELEIFNRALDQTEIQAIYNAGSAGMGKCQGMLPPAGPNAFRCLPAPPAAVLSKTPASAQPLFVSNPTASDVLVGLAFAAFSGPVDIYSAVQTPWPSPYDLLI
jgi:hypothetical protein